MMNAEELFKKVDHTLLKPGGDLGSRSKICAMRQSGFTPLRCASIRAMSGRPVTICRDMYRCAR